MSRTTPSLRDRIVGLTLTAAAVVLMVVYGRGQLVHTLRFLREWMGLS